MIWTFAALAILLGPMGLVLGASLSLLLERRLIAALQRRLGISFLGRQGWSHLPADVVKFWLKETSRHWRGSGGLGIALALGSYLGWSLISAVFLVAGGGVAVIDFWDFHLLTYAAYANLTTTFLAHLAAATRSKYATAASARTVLLAAYLEVFFAAAMLIVYAHSGGYSLEALHAADTWLIVALPPVALTLSVFAVFEAKRAPYDHSEAESELVAGHLVEYGGRSLLLFFVCEYIHLYVCVAYITVVILGGTGDFGLAWLFPFTVPPSAY